MLQARKHAQVAQRVAYCDHWSWQGGKGRGVKGRSSGWQEGEWNGDGEGKGKKGGKNKSKSKSPRGGKQSITAENEDSKPKAHAPTVEICTSGGASAPSEVGGVSGQGPPADFKSSLEACTNLKQYGIWLAWWMLAGY